MATFWSQIARLFWALQATSHAATFGVGTTFGVMQQPTSHYYHATYGSEVTAGTDSEGLLVRGAYLERPEFRGGGYSDKDYGWFLEMGSKLTKKSRHGLYAFLGGGRMAGYTKSAATATAAATSSGYAQSGVITGVEYALRFGGFDIAAEHMLFVGAVDKEQLQSYVAWPFTFFQIRMGATW